MQEIACLLRQALLRRSCVGCALTLQLDESLFCTACHVSVEPFPGPAAAFVYEAALRQAVLRFKHARCDATGRALALRMAQHWSGPVPDAVVPIPLHWTRRLQRGFNQSAILAWPLARRLDRPLRPAWLRRRRRTRSQGSCADAAARLQNLAGAFVASTAVDGHRILLIDDVRASGATLRVARAALHAAGAAEVSSYTLAAVL